MAYGLSFSNEFFYGTEDYYSMEPSDRPTNCLQAIMSLDDETKKGIAKDVLKIRGKKNIEFAIKSESFDFDVLEKLREYDTCVDLSSPVEVYINGDYTITVYDDEEDEDDE